MRHATAPCNRLPCSEDWCGHILCTARVIVTHKPHVCMRRNGRWFSHDSSSPSHSTSIRAVSMHGTCNLQPFSAKYYTVSSSKSFNSKIWYQCVCCIHFSYTVYITVDSHNTNPRVRVMIQGCTPCLPWAITAVSVRQTTVNRSKTVNSLTAIRSKCIQLLWFSRMASVILRLFKQTMFRRRHVCADVRLLLIKRNVSSFSPLWLVSCQCDGYSAHYLIQ